MSLLPGQKIFGSILCVDDDEDDASLLESAVATLHEGLVFVKCYGGKEALDFLKETATLPNIILLDVNMPLMNGFECLSHIRGNNRFDGIPVIMLSTSARPKDVEAALELGAHKFFTKPNTYKQIHSMMSEIIVECLVEK
jgi:CheY-like chemotaxis protein